MFSQNFETILLPQAELHLLKVENLDVCIRDVLIMSVGIIIGIVGEFSDTDIGMPSLQDYS